MSDLEQYEATFPFIPWRTPVRVVVTGNVKAMRWCCRVCIAKGGITASALQQGAGYATERECKVHILTHLGKGNA